MILSMNFEMNDFIDEFSDPDFESLWVWLRPMRLPRGFPCLVAGTVYHSVRR